MKKNAFTLVEILITLGIIAVVAAMTIPVIIENSMERKFVTLYKKSLSTLNQAVIRIIAQYDMDYSSINTASKDETCKTDTFQKGDYTLCGLLNSTLAAPTYLGKYGNIMDFNGENLYTVSISNFSAENYLFFSFSDGIYLAFNPNAVKCGIGIGRKVRTEMMTSGELVNCIGFVDVNGANPPNREIQCASGTTEISANTTCEVTNASIGDIFPIVFHDGLVEPATNATRTVFLGGNSKPQD